MKFKLELTINKPRSEVWDLFITPESMNKWQPSLKGIELISGMPGQTGAVSKLTYEEGGREFSITETITHREDQKQFNISYENEFTINPMKNTFIEQGENKTKWIIGAEFKFKTFTMKLLGPLLKKNFVRRTQKEMDRFKEFRENS